MKIGLRVVKTAVSIMISIFIARLLGLEPDHFAGIISMLAVQPSVYRSLRNSMSNLASAMFAALLGISVVELTGSSTSFLIALVAFIVMALLVRLKKTASLPLAVIITVNTMGTADELFGSAALHQLSLVLIGMTVGTAVNMIRRPVHHEREESLLTKAETMLRALLYYVSIDVENGRMTPYKPGMRQQIDEVRSYIEKGNAVSQLIREDRWLTKATQSPSGSGERFLTYETMVERIRDLIKALEKADLTLEEAARLKRAIWLLARAQERVISGKRVPFRLLNKALHPDETKLVPDGKALRDLFPYYQAYEALREYGQEMPNMRSNPTPAAIRKPSLVTKLKSSLHLPLRNRDYNKARPPF
ncbi:aromatic acid exporter family protein [Paenibacillus koleovorans]|uniref:aromatic acid exporter family protein n=1 Tax=Paenibacillus koleovorans TaxID=121608 RepID=UPI000FD7D7A8|nr:aromatic acid exporter family protein [Paenibacillus koleovorans]